MRKINLIVLAMLALCLLAAPLVLAVPGAAATGVHNDN